MKTKLVLLISAFAALADWFGSLDADVQAHLGASYQGARGDGGALVYVFETPAGSLFYQDTSGHWSGILRDLGFRVCRVRHHDDVARIELGRDEMARALEPRMADAIVARVKAAGYRFVTIDLQGYRLGSLNERIPLRVVSS